tara:strand:- start:251 stop:448 length:198 start_codon:yes stop_codon:yes gene_type:complete
VHIDEFDKDEINVIISCLEIARIVLSGKEEGTLLWTKEYCVDQLDISDEEVDILEEKIELLLNAK